MTEITIKDIALKCGVGVSTVSRAINNHPDINQETKKKIMQVIEEYNYIPNNNARNLKRADAKCIALIVKGITNPFFSSMIQVIEERSKKVGYALVLRHVNNSEDEVEIALELIKEKKLRGIIFLGGCFTHSKEKIEKIKIPFVFGAIGNDVLEDGMNELQYSTVSVDDRKEGHRITSYLMDLGHKDIAIISTDIDTESIGSLRVKGYLDAFMERGIPINPELIRNVRDKVKSFSYENGYITTKELIDSGEKFTAIFAITDILAIGACRAIYEAGYRIPQDISVIGFDGIEIGEYMMPALTTLKQPLEKIAEATINLLIEILHFNGKHQHIVYPGEIIERESTCRLQ